MTGRWHRIGNMDYIRYCSGDFSLLALVCHFYIHIYNKMKSVIVEVLFGLSEFAICSSNSLIKCLQLLDIQIKTSNTGGVWY